MVAIVIWLVVTVLAALLAFTRDNDDGAVSARACASHAVVFGEAIDVADGGVSSCRTANPGTG